MKKLQTIGFYLALIVSVLLWGQWCLAAFGGFALGGKIKSPIDLLIFLPWVALVAAPWFAVVMRRKGRSTLAWCVVLAPYFIQLVAMLYFTITFTHAPIKSEAGRDVYVTHIGKTEYHIPTTYTGIINDNIKDVLIDATLPDMSEPKPIPEHDPAGMRAIMDNAIGMLITDAATTTSFEYRFGVTKKEYSPLTPLGEQFGLQAYISDMRMFGMPIEKGSPVYSGSDIVKNPTQEQIAKLREEFYVDSDTPTVFISCNGDASVPSPGCSEEFSDNGLLYKLHFRKIHLKEWRSIKDSAINLMHGFMPIH